MRKRILIIWHFTSVEGFYIWDFMCLFFHFWYYVFFPKCFMMLWLKLKFKWKLTTKFMVFLLEHHWSVWFDLIWCDTFFCQNNIIYYIFSLPFIHLYIFGYFLSSFTCFRADLMCEVCRHTCNWFVPCFVLVKCLWLYFTSTHWQRLSAETFVSAMWY